MTAGFGLEKLGLVALRFPRAVLAIVLAVTCVLGWYSTKLQFSSDIREIFRSASGDFANYEDVARQFPASDRNVLIVVEGGKLFEAKRLEQLRSLHLELSLTDNVGNVLSMFSARRPPDANGKTERIFPVEFDGSEDLAALEREIQTHPLISGKLLAKDGRLALFVMSFMAEQSDIDALARVTEDVRSLAKEMLAGTGLSATLSGASVMRVEIIGALIRDQKTFRLAGLTAALLLCWIFFRSFSYVLIATAPAAVSIIGLKGGMALAGQNINVLTNVIPTLVLVIAFSSALHLLFAIRRNIAKGIGIDAAIARAVEEVGPACVLTSATTAIALLSLTLVQHRFVTSFGLTAACGTALAYIGIMTTVPPLCRILLRNAKAEDARRGEADWIHQAVGAVSAAAARLVHSHAPLITILGILIAMGAGFLHSLNVPTYQYQDSLPKGNAAFGAIETINHKLSGANQLLLRIQWPESHELKSTATLDVVRAAHEVMEKDPIVRTVSSLHSVEMWFVKGGLGRDELFAYLEDTPTQLSKRVYSPAHNSALVTGNFASLPAAELIAALDRLEAELEPVGARFPDAKMTLTGLVPVSAKASTEMIGELNQSLMVAVGVIILLIGLALRSAVAGLESILPNVLPIAVAGAALYVFDKGLQFNSVVAFTIGFGIAVDSSIHVLNRYRLIRQGNEPVGPAIESTITAIGPVLIVATAVLVAGVGGTMLSELPMVRLYGQVITLLLTTALLGNMLLLPAIIRLVDGWRQSRGGAVPAGDETQGGKAAR